MYRSALGAHADPDLQPLIRRGRAPRFSRLHLLMVCAIQRVTTMSHSNYTVYDEGQSQEFHWWVQYMERGVTLYIIIDFQGCRMKRLTSE